ncbi:MAG: flagellar motor switch protein FliM [Thermodesulfobacteriota bacterium]|nr:flagellar motor switch protein FliM [Thermodesulfobacteriota bacterium]
MAQILSQDEIDALLKGVSDGEVETEQEPDEIIDPTGIEKYDLTSQDRIIKDRMPALDVIFDSFSRLLGSSFSVSLRKAVDVRLRLIEMVKFGGFLNSIPLPSNLNLIQMEPLPGLAILVVEAKLVFSFVDYFFGGSGADIKIEGREFSAIEQKVMAKFVSSMLDDLKEAWEPIQPLDIELVRTEMNPQFAGIVSPDDVVMVASFEVELEKSTGNMSVCIPYSTLEPIRDKLLPGVHKVKLGMSKKWADFITSHLKEIDVDITVELGRTTINIEQVLNLQVNDVIQLERYVDDELVLKVEGVPKFVGYPGLSKGNRALQVTSIASTRGR